MRHPVRALVATLLVVGTAAAGCTGSPPSASDRAAPATTAAAPATTAAAPGTPSGAASPSAPGPAPATTPAPDPLRLTVMTYNTLTGRNDCAGCRALRAAGRGDELALGKRMPVVADKVALADPDIIGFQENEGGDRLPQTYLAPLLTRYSWAEPTASVPIAYRSGSFRLVESGVSVLEDGPVSCRSGDRTDGRFAGWALLEVVATGQRLWVFNAHLHPYDTRACARLRARNVDRLLAVIAGKNPGGDLPQLVLGDFNAFGDERRTGFRHHLEALADAGMVDAHAVAETDESDVPGAASAGRMTAPVAGRDRVGVIRRGGRYLDYVWVPQDAAVASWQVLSGPGIGYRRIAGERVPYWTSVMASDHSPVVVSLTLPVRP